jgi:hypothetical protein
MKLFQSAIIVSPFMNVSPFFARSDVDTNNITSSHSSDASSIKSSCPTCGGFADIGTIAIFMLNHTSKNNLRKLYTVNLIKFPSHKNLTV